MSYVRPLTEPAEWPSKDKIFHGQYVSLVALHVDHVDPLWPAVQAQHDAPFWEYLTEGPYETREEFESSVKRRIDGRPGRMAYTIMGHNSEGKTTPLGRVGFLHIDLAQRTTEMGITIFSVDMQRTPRTTECVYLLLKYAIEDLGFRRVEWRTHAENIASWRAAVRLGFTYEGTRRQVLIVRGKNWDVAHFSIIDLDWPAVKAGLLTWLDRSNFDEKGAQKRTLQEIREAQALHSDALKN